MEMARITLRMTRVYLVAALAIGAAMGTAGCGKPICPPGTRADAKRSKPGQNAFCVNPTDTHQAAFVELHPNGAQRQVCPLRGWPTLGSVSGLSSGRRTLARGAVRKRPEGRTLDAVGG